MSRGYHWFVLSSLIVLIYSLVLGNIIVFFSFLSFYLVFFLFFKVIFYSPWVGGFKRIQLLKWMHLGVLAFVLVAISVDFERKMLMNESNKALPTVGNENTFYELSLASSEYLTDGRSWSDIDYLLNLDNPSYVFVIAVLQSVSLSFIGEGEIFLNVIPNIFMGVFTALMLFQIYNRGLSRKLTKPNNALLLFLFFPLLMMYSIVGLRDAIVFFFSILAIHSLTFDKLIIRVIIILLCGWVLYHTRIFSAVLLFQGVLIIAFYRAIKPSFKQSVIIVSSVIVVFFLAKIVLLSQFSLLTSDNLAMTVDRYSAAGVYEADENSLAIRLGEMGIPGVQFVLYFLDPLFTTLFSTNGQFSLLRGLGGVTWNFLVLVFLICLWHKKEARVHFMTSPHFLVSFIIIVEVFGITGELRHKLPFMLLFLMEVAVTVHNFQLMKVVKRTLIYSISSVGILFIIYVTLRG